MNVKGRRWAHIPGGTGCLIAPGTPNQNLYVESYNGRFRYECLNEHWCTSLAHAKVRIDGWRREDYEERPTKGLAGLTPAPLRQAVGSETQYRHPRTLNRSATQNGGTSGGRSRAPGRIGGAPACIYEGSVRASWQVMGTKWGTKIIYSKHNILIINHLARINGGEGGIRTHVPVARQDAFEAPPLRPLRYLSVSSSVGRKPSFMARRSTACPGRTPGSTRGTRPQARRL